MQNIIKLYALLILCSSLGCQQEYHSDWKPDDGYITNEASAIKIAEIVWRNVYGSEINDKKPFKASLKDGKIWVIVGTLDKDKLGGVPYIEIQKSDGKILAVKHGK